VCVCVCVCVVWILFHVQWLLWIKLWPATVQHLPHVPLSFKHQLARRGCVCRSKFRNICQPLLLNFFWM